ncbi:3-hydroxy-3-methylglutaryl-coenzyme A reductase [Drechslerella dactyloides]|uniref:3-hydroxy-3-methylglutaryl-coenzyme A reductase n=1 Tax=Drechslerella dactyloides TaxID=74499 RepID=A0AAD6IXJ9_DREDA|nr:3-hydroxy-3-methylglutaryl-coenzyme A reductase [Drechslerella dactyloides]
MSASFRDFKNNSLHSLGNITQNGAAAKQLEGIKIENAIGFAQVPIGIAGPLDIHGLYQQQKGVMAPLATLEATLVASCSRGCKVLQACGGVHAAALSEGMSRAPVFRFSTIRDAVEFYRQIPAHFEELQESAHSSSRFVRLVSVTPHVVGADVHVKFVYTSGDAAGQNMTTIATQKACMDLLESRKDLEPKIIGFFICGQMSSDKKMSWGNVREPRGVQVLAWATITNEACQRILRCNTADLSRDFASMREGMIRNGGMGTSVNTANVISAMFLACGQDSASVLESGWVQLTHEHDPKTQDLTLSMFFPSLVVGTTGGGTGYATQREALELIDCYGPGKKFALAETIAAFCLALDVSTTSAGTTNTFSDSHKRMARADKMSKI